MNIHQRINARKIVLSYFYKVCFFDDLLSQDSAIKEALFIDNVFESQTEKFSQEREDFLNNIKKEYLDGEEIEDGLMYILHYFFDEWKAEDVDIDYVLKVGKNINQYKDEIIQKVNGYTQSFTFHQMDLIDQALFVLGYVEWKELATPKEVLLNELVELAKRYSDEGSPKLLNGIMHNILTGMINDK